MPWTPAQHRLFEWASHSPQAAAAQGYHIKQGDAARMAGEGIKRCSGGLAMAAGGQPTQYQPVSSYTGNPLDASPENDAMMLLDNFGAVQPHRFAEGGQVPGGGVQTADDLLEQANQLLAGHKDQSIQDELNNLLRQLGPQKPQGFAEGGDVDMGDLLKYGALAAPAAMMSRRPLNMAARPIQRALTRPVMGFESVRDPSHAAMSEERMQSALSGSQSPLAKLPVWRGQGAFMNPKGELETNPLYAQALPRTPGRVDRNPDMMRYAGEVGNSLNQWAVPIQRAMPNLFNIPAGADSLLLNKIGPDEIKRLAQAVPNDTVVSHRPGNRGLVFSTSTTPPDIRDLRDLIQKTLPGSKSRYAVSRPGVDRVLVGEEPWMDKTYKELGLR